MDTRYVEKLHEKQQQHQGLEASLRAYGYDVSVLPIVLGFYGTISISAVKVAHTLGIERKGAIKLLLALHMHAITTLHAAVRLRRKLEVRFQNRGSHRNRLN